MASTNLKMLNKTGNNIFSDECYTPPQAIDPLLSYLPIDWIYYDCTSGKSSKIIDFLKTKNINERKNVRSNRM